MSNPSNDLSRLLARRFADAPVVPDDMPSAPALPAMAGRGSCRSFQAREVPLGWLETLSAVAMAAPTKSDLQGRDIILIQLPEKRVRLADLVGGQAWVRDAPSLAVFCGNNRRQRLLHDWHDVPFANDHLDAFFNAACDAAITLGAFVTAAESIGLGCCPISAVRNEAAAVSELLDLPEHVFPFAGLAIGFPAQSPPVSPRLPLGQTCHIDSYSDDGLQDDVTAYDTTRSYATQRFSDKFGTSPNYGWSEDKVRQYSQPERVGFGAFVRNKGFRLD